MLTVSKLNGKTRRTKGKSISKFNLVVSFGKPTKLTNNHSLQIPSPSQKGVTIVSDIKDSSYKNPEIGIPEDLKPILKDITFRKNLQIVNLGIYCDGKSVLETIKNDWTGFF